MELKSCFNSPTCTSMTAHLGGIRSPEDGLSLTADEETAGFARFTVSPEATFAAIILAICIRPDGERGFDSEIVPER